jgi:hypothetical protein
MYEKMTKNQTETYTNGFTVKNLNPSKTKRSMRRTSIEGVPRGLRFSIGREGEVPLR